MLNIVHIPSCKGTGSDFTAFCCFVAISPSFSTFVSNEVVYERVFLCELLMINKVMKVTEFQKYVANKHSILTRFSVFTHRKLN